MKEAADKAMEPRDEMIVTTALLLGCDIKNVSEDGWDPIYEFTGADGKPSGRYLSKTIACDMYLSQIGVYVDGQAVIHGLPNLTR